MGGGEEEGREGIPAFFANGSTLHRLLHHAHVCGLVH